MEVAYIWLVAATGKLHSNDENGNEEESQQRWMSPGWAELAGWVAVAGHNRDSINGCAVHVAGRILFIT